MFSQAWWPWLSAPDALARLADPALVARVAGTELNAAQQELLCASYRDRERTADWSVADTALLDELAAQLGPVPEPEDREVSLFLDSDLDGNGEVQELVTTMERLAPVREVDPFAAGSGHLRPRSGRRGPGHHADAVADAPPPRTERQLDDRR